MNLARMLSARAAEGRPIGVGLIGAGKFGTMFLAQARLTPGFKLVGIADLSHQRIYDALERTGWAADEVPTTDDAAALVAADGVEVVVEVTGDPAAGAAHALAAFAAGRHVVMVTVEGDALVGPLLARRAREAGVLYSLAYGDQPALICELVDWARASGFEVVCAGKGTKYLPRYHASTPDTVWEYYGFDPEMVAGGDYNARMFNSFLDGTKSSIEMAAVANATGLKPPAGGLDFPPCEVDELSAKLIPQSEGGVLDRAGMVEVISSLARNGTPLAHDLRWGVYVTFAAPSEYARRSFLEYGLKTDASGRYASLYRPYHLIGLELGISVASVALRGEATGAPAAFHADVVATAKRDLVAGEALDGEGGYTVHGRLMPAADSLSSGALPLGLANGLCLVRPVAAGTAVGWDDVEPPPATPILALRREMEALFAPPGAATLSPRA
jgi:predicted homoserine dehydrogenase-like protein